VNAARTDGALLAGVCAGTAQAFGWNVWVLRALFIGLLLIKTVWALVAYAALALLFYFFDEGLPGSRKKPKDGLASPELSERNKRIADLEARFRELEGKD